MSGPGPTTESPNGWLFSGNHGSTNIAGNNVSAYLDAVSDNRSDSFGTTITNGVFDTLFNASVQPSTQDNRNVAVQNLFYLNNVIHDELYRHGFTEAEGNFQQGNFGRGGRGNDPVNAEAQDGGGTDNANFATPTDGKKPRMQMYLWTGLGTHQVVVGVNTYLAQGAEFGPALTDTGVNREIVLANDGVGATSDGCESFAAGAFGDKIALIDRGTCTFVVKVKNAQNAGAVGVIVANNQGDGIITMGGTDSTITIPSVFIGQSDGGTLRLSLPASGTIRLTNPAPLMRDGDVDSDIVFHEYCHGLTWRMIGQMSGPLAGALGEGMSDVCALMMNQDPVIGEYSSSDPRGIRRDPYNDYPRTYSSVTGAEVHDDGEIYGAIGWQLMQNFTGRNDTLFGYMVDGMNYTPSKPTFEMMRDGMLQAVGSGNAADQCLVWDAFAHFGVGVGSKGVVRRNTVIITESFSVPRVCGGP